MAGRKPKNEPMTQAEMIEAGRQKKATSKLYKAEYQETDSAVSKDSAIRKTVANALSEFKRSKNRPVVKLDDYETVRSIAEAYLESCAVVSVFPSMAGLAISMGHTRESLYRYMERKPDSETTKLLVQFHDLMANIISENGMRNNSHPIMSIFLLKSMFGYKDTTTFEISQGITFDDKLAVDEIAKRADLLSDD